MPATLESRQTLDAVLVKFNPFYNRALLLSSTFPDNYEKVACLKQDALKIEREFHDWANSQPEEWSPRPLGKLDVYFDRKVLLAPCVDVLTSISVCCRSMEYLSKIPSYTPRVDLTMLQLLAR